MGGASNHLRGSSGRPVKQVVGVIETQPVQKKPDDNERMRESLVQCEEELDHLIFRGVQR